MREPFRPLGVELQRKGIVQNADRLEPVAAGSERFLIGRKKIGFGKSRKGSFFDLGGFIIRRVGNDEKEGGTGLAHGPHACEDIRIGDYVSGLYRTENGTMIAAEFGPLSCERNEITRTDTGIVGK